ncbi:MAG: hypothetical protein PWQ82_1677 [Thermosediminibacterales bacterium]|nr:hypothetical protein [Thermosediminibacterales bacterium]MDK2836273.1 hypothetical protein [Thermosediminibacterales bacterium]
MTHSLHRRGNLENLKDDYVVLVTPAVGINHKDSKEKLRKIIDKIFELGPNNIGSYETGTVFSGATIEQIKEQLSETPRVRCCFDDKEKVKKLIKFIKDNDFGLSVTISGLIDDVKSMAKEENLSPHSINLSLGIYGKTDELPSEEVLEFVTMCGHGMISRYLVEKLIDDVKKGRKTPQKAAEIMAKPCVCGIFNVKRAKQLLEKYAK